MISFIPFIYFSITGILSIPPAKTIFAIIGCFPTILLAFLVVSPYEIVLRTHTTENQIIFEVEKNYVITNTKLVRTLSKQTKIEIYVPRKDVLAGNDFPISRVRFTDLKGDKVPISLFNSQVRGLKLLGYLVSVFPTGIRISSSKLDRPTGGFHTSLEPKIGEIELTIPSHTDYGEPLSKANLEKYIHDPRFERRVKPSKKNLLGKIIWGFPAFFIFGIMSVVSLYAVGYGIFNNLSVGDIVGPGLVAFIGLPCFFYFFNSFSVKSFAHLFGKYSVKEQNGSILISLQKWGLHSYTYTFPLSLNPRIFLDGSKLSIICRDDYSQYYELPIGKMT